MCLVVWFVVVYNIFRIGVVFRSAPPHTTSSLLAAVFVVVFTIGGYVLYGYSDLMYSDPACHKREQSLLAGMIVASVITTIIYNRLAARGSSSGGGGGDTRQPTQSTHRLLFIALALLIGGITAHKLDLRGVWCWPSSWFQGHAIWHLATAGALHSVYLYLRSEHRIEPDKII